MESKNEKIATIGRFTYSSALLIQAMLKSNDIESFCVAQKTEQPAIGEFVEIKVKYSDISKAMKLLEESEHDYGNRNQFATDHMLPVKRILVPVDFSEDSMLAARFALSLSSGYKAEVRLLHVYYNPAIDAAPYNEHYTYQVRLTGILQEIERNAREGMNRTIEQLKAWSLENLQTRVKLSSVLVNGNTNIEIQNYANSYWPALIVLGTRGLTKRSMGSLGSVTMNLFEKSDFPILSIPGSGPLKIESIKNLLFATDFDQADFSVINRLAFLIKPFEIRIHCVHISVGQKKPWEVVKMEDLKQSLAEEYWDSGIEFHHLVSDSVLNGLESYVRNHRIDLISATSHKKGFLEKFFSTSITNLIFGEMNIPMLVFHSLT
jgi:nucleotide-binding universal stress UspA family protein